MSKISGKEIMEFYKLEEEYEKMFNKDNTECLYPRWWYSVDYGLRKKIIKDALSKESMIKDLEEVQEMEYRRNINMLFEEYKVFSTKAKKKS